MHLIEHIKNRPDVKPIERSRGPIIHIIIVYEPYAQVSDSEYRRRV